MVTSTKVDDSVQATMIISAGKGKEFINFTFIIVS